MAQNKTLPYGYQIQNGKLTIHDEESEVVRRIYADYAKGKSYKVIAQMLTSEDIRYVPEKPVWNKNMVARILQNNCYTGRDSYPEIIDSNLNLSAELAKKAYTPSTPKDIKEIKPLLSCGICGGKLNRQVNRSGRIRWRCENDISHISAELQDKDILTAAINIQQQLCTLKIEPPTADNAISLDVIRLQNEIERLFETVGTNMSEIQSKMLELAQLKYSLYPYTTHMEEKIIEEIKKAPDKLNNKLLGKLTQSIEITNSAVSGITLKNGLRVRKE